MVVMIAERSSLVVYNLGLGGQNGVRDDFAFPKSL
jgi:hypothetical protein